MILNTKSPLFKIFILMALTCINLTAQAKVWESNKVVHYQGQISQKDNEALKALLDTKPEHFTRLVINSGGGNVDLGMDLAELVLEHNLDVEVPRFCFSSCANYVFIAGKTKWLGEKAVLGWHGNAGSARWLDEDIDAMVSKESAKKRDKKWQELRKHYDDVIEVASKRETAFYKRLEVNPELLSVGHQPEFMAVARKHKLRGWTFPIQELNRMGINNIRSTGLPWTPNSPQKFPLAILGSAE